MEERREGRGGREEEREACFGDGDRNDCTGV